MELKTWLDKERGRYAALAEFLGISAGRMSQIAVDGVPVKYMPAVRDFTKGEVTLDVMVAKRATEPERVA